MRKLVIVLSVIAALLAAAPAQAHLAYKPKGDSLNARLKAQTLNLKHAKYVCKNGRGEHREWACWASSSVIRRNGQGWLARERNKTRAALAPKRVTGTFGLPECTNELLGREGGWNPHATNPISGAYGGPQALPGSKMASAGSDWRDNIWTQIRWMIWYVNDRYGSMCAALSFQIANNYY